MIDRPPAGRQGRHTLLRLRLFDVVAILVALAAIGGFSLLAYSGGSGPAEVVIEASGSRWIYPLGEDRTVSAHGPIGETIVVIGGGKAFVKDSPCPDKLCVLSGAISRPGQWVACLPNKIMVSIRGGSEQSVDVTSF